MDVARIGAPVPPSPAEPSVAGRLARTTIEASFTLVTTDGDRVTLGATSSYEVQLGSYSSDGTMVQRGSLSASGSVSMSIEGELDAEEWRDLRKALRAFRRAGRDGVIEEKELRSLTRRHDLDTVASVGGSLDVTRQVVSFSATA